MKNYTITVNGNVYDVTVEENIGQGQPAAPRLDAPKVPPTPKAAPKPATVPQVASGATKIEAGAAGKIFKVEVSVGQQVKKGDSVIILEAMKMEIPVVAPKDGTVASIVVAAGEAVEAGTLLATLN